MWEGGRRRGVRIAGGTSCEFFFWGWVWVERAMGADAVVCSCNALGTDMIMAAQFSTAGKTQLDWLALVLSMAVGAAMAV